MPHRILVTRHLFPGAIDHLRRHAEVDYHDSNDGLDPAALAERARDKQGLVCQLTDPITAEVLAAPGLRVVSQVAVGYDNVDLDAARERSIVVTNTPGVLTDTTADLAFALLLAAARRIVEADRFVRDARWRQWEIDLLCGKDIHGATLGVVGMGRIGRAVTRRALGFDMRVLFHDERRLPGIEGAEQVPLERLLRESDFVSLHVPLAPETRHLIDGESLALMKPTAILVNTARGPVVDEPALAEALATGRIAGAALDVFEREPEVEARLLERDNVVLAPHLGSASEATRARMCRMAAEDCVAVLEGRAPAHPVA